MLDQTQKPKHLFATCRDPSKADELTALAKDHPELHVLRLEVSDHSQYEPLARTVANKVGDQGLNLLINNAGVLPKESEGLTAEHMREGFEVMLKTSKLEI